MFRDLYCLEIIVYESDRPLKSDYAEMFKVLSAVTRVKIINLLRTHGPLCGSDIARRLGVSASAVSQHLHRLRHAGLVSSERRGYHVPYTINVPALEAYRNYVDDVIANHGQTPAAALKNEARELEQKLKSVRRQMKHFSPAKSSSS